MVADEFRRLYWLGALVSAVWCGMNLLLVVEGEGGEDSLEV
jgi:hypothetical protein